jgi:RHS repeat-associated protein
VPKALNNRLKCKKKAPDAALYYYRNRFYDPQTGRFISPSEHSTSD